MSFQPHNDLHIHSCLSACSADPEQTPARILRYAQENGLSDICLTDHCWDESVPGIMDFYRGQGIDHVRRSLPLPQAERVRFHFGCEADMNADFALGISPAHLDKFSFIIASTTHMHHMEKMLLPSGEADIPRLADLYVRRIDKLLSMDLPFHRMGLGHPTCFLLAQAKWQAHLQVLESIPDDTLRELFFHAARVGIGIELNVAIENYKEDERPVILRVYRIARACGCRFYFGSDAHHPDVLEGLAMARFTEIARLLDLEEKDRFYPDFADV